MADWELKPRLRATLRIFLCCTTNVRHAWIIGTRDTPRNLRAATLISRVWGGLQTRLQSQGGLHLALHIGALH